MRLRVLCTGDIHLGRFPSRIHPRQHALSVASVWETLVEYAIEHKYDAVILTGDVIDRPNRFYEAFGPLQKGLEKLAAHQVATFAVSGNHDFDALVRFADTLQIPGFTLLGRDGKWQCATLERDGEVRANIMGWSFPSQYVRHSPLQDFNASHVNRSSDAVPLIGVLHADLDQASSPYAPVMRHELSGQGVSAWLLGHIHKPMCDTLLDGTVVIYPGALQALDPGETGTHGPWSIEFDGARVVDAKQISLASVRYEDMSVDLSEIVHPEQFERHIIDVLRQQLIRLVSENPSLRRIVYRLSFRGRTPLHRQVAQLSAGLLEMEVHEGLVTATVDHFEVSTRPQVDLQELARSHDPVGVLAQVLIDVEAGCALPETKRMMRDMLEQLRILDRSNAYSPLPASYMIEDDALIRASVLEQGFLLLDELLSQKDSEVMR